jgi:tellurite resistance protein TehA-like permease
MLLFRWHVACISHLSCKFYLRSYQIPFFHHVRPNSVSMYVHNTKLSAMTAAWLLPVVSTIVAAASGGVVASVLPNPQHALWTIIVSYILWGTGVPLAMVVLVMYFHRLTIHRLPPREVIVSVFLPLGPLGQGGFGIMQLGKVAMDIMPKTHYLIPGAGEVLYVVGFGVASVMWGFGLVWLFFAIASISRSKFPFNMGTFLTSCLIFPQKVIKS